ncbi:arabinogalactan endo-1,4-beta-galactosidase [Salibacterium salarium]|uniref:glycoside hydrolase family 53 protein n=1 Tax=Salibacterium salarium TaxID=284579 RepID=UPI002787322A|nr:glycosyl hydrolase 53 family protein [Salibacterium salarium]MDQ0298001.1 arabinogalactan endo-1,4-beta-galactosidase [Salibacterium salarium]
MKKISLIFMTFILSSTVLWNAGGNVAAASQSSADRFIKGADISSLAAVEDNGGQFYDRSGKLTDPVDVLDNHGANYIRLRLWNNPEEMDGYNDVEDTISLAKRAKERDMKVLLDFHYSDFWADPGRQDKPAAWSDLSSEELVEEVYTYSKEVIEKMKEENVAPDMVQIGNEIQNGVLWPDGALSGEDAGGFDQLADVLKAGIEGVHDGASHDDTEIMLHLADGGDNDMYQWFFDEITDRNVAFDVIGLSYYPYWHGTIEELKHNLNDISNRYDKDVAVAETSYGYTDREGDGWENIFTKQEAEIAGYPISIQGQAKSFRDVMKAVRDVPNDRGRGVFYWEPIWIPVEGAGWRSGEGNAWENQAMFDFEGRALPSLNVFRMYGN